MRKRPMKTIDGIPQIIEGVSYYAHLGKPVADYAEKQQAGSGKFGWEINLAVSDEIFEKFQRAGFNVGLRPAGKNNYTEDNVITFYKYQLNFNGTENSAPIVVDVEKNRFEDMTVDMRAADFQAQQGRQQRSDIMQGLRGAAGSSGVGGLAQSLANAGAMQSQQIAAGIGQQERQNQLLSAQQGSRMDQMEREGQAAVQAAEAGKQSTLLGMDYGALAGANQAYQGSLANQMAGMGMKADMYGAQSQNNMFSTLVDAGAQLGSAYLGTEAGSQALTNLFKK